MKTPNWFKKYPLWLLCLTFCFLYSCKDESFNEDLFSGLWIQEQVTEDGIPMQMTEKEKSLKLLIEPNGVYRSYATDGVTPDHKYGTWITTNNQWIDFTTDIWAVKTRPTTELPTGTWARNHMIARFTVLSITDEVMEVRIKTFVGWKKYSTLFTDEGRPQLTLNNIDEIEQEYRTLKTYIFTFKKQ